jgi:hypothetical protein
VDTIFPHTIAKAPSHNQKVNERGHLLIEILLVLALLIVFMKNTIFLGIVSQDKLTLKNAVLTGYHTLSFARLLSLSADRDTVITTVNEEWIIDDYALGFNTTIKGVHTTDSIFGFKSAGTGRSLTMTFSKGISSSKLSLVGFYGKTNIK